MAFSITPNVGDEATVESKLNTAKVPPGSVENGTTELNPLQLSGLDMHSPKTCIIQRKIITHNLKRTWNEKTGIAT